MNNTSLTLRSRFTIVLVALLLIALNFQAPASAGLPSAASQAAPAETDPFVPGELVMRLSGTTDLAQADALAKLVNGQRVSSIPSLNLHLVKLPKSANLNAAGEKAIDVLKAQPQILFAEPNYLGQIDVLPPSSVEPSQLLFTPNDTQRAKQWQLAASKQNLYNAWNLTKGSTDVKIAILDTGIDIDHPDISAKVLTSQDYDFYNGDATPQDDNDHGSHVAGIAAASMNNSRGIAGIAGENNVIAVKVCSAGGSCPVYAVANGITHSVLKNARVINMSLGWRSPSYTLQSAVDYAWSQGVVVVASSGNTGTDFANFPAAYQSTVSVGSTGYDDLVSWYSTRHNTVDLTASGGSGTIDTENIYSLNSTGVYIWLAGTSMAAPQVTGALGLYFSLYPSATPIDARACLHATVDDKGVASWDATYGWGRLDVYNLLNCAPLGRRVLIDNSHTNINISNGDTFRYEAIPGLWEDLVSRGYKVTWSSDVGFTSLGGYDIVILFDPHANYSAGEKSTIKTWLENGSGNKLITLCENGGYSSNAALNDLHASLGSGIQCPAAILEEPELHDSNTYWPSIFDFKRGSRANSTVWETGLYAGTYLTVASPAQAVAWSSAASTGTVLALQGGSANTTGINGSNTIIGKSNLNAVGPLPVAAAGRLGPSSIKGFVFAISDTDIWSTYGVCGSRACRERAADNLHWFENVLGYR